MGIVDHVRNQLIRKVTSYTPNIRKKGARRRVWWHPKLLKNRFYKGYGAGSMMSRTNDGILKLDPEKMRQYVAPQISSASGLKPYVESSIFVEKEPKITCWDYFNAMKEQWSDDKLPEFRKTIQNLDSYGRKAGKMKNWGY